MKQLIEKIKNIDGKFTVFINDIKFINNIIRGGIIKYCILKMFD